MTAAQSFLSTCPLSHADATEYTNALHPPARHSNEPGTRVSGARQCERHLEAWRAVYMSATLPCMSWNSPMGVPN